MIYLVQLLALSELLTLLNHIEQFFPMACEVSSNASVDQYSAESSKGSPLQNAGALSLCASLSSVL